MFFTSVCQEFCPGGVYPSMQWADTPLADTPLADTPQADTPWQTPRSWQTPPGRLPWQTPPVADTPHPPDGHCSGPYASYWNAFLF